MSVLLLTLNAGASTRTRPQRIYYHSATLSGRIAARMNHETCAVALLLH
jgi:hypothetical protein